MIQPDRNNDQENRDVVRWLAFLAAILGIGVLIVAVSWMTMESSPDVEEIQRAQSEAVTLLRMAIDPWASAV